MFIVIVMGVLPLKLASVSSNVDENTINADPGAISAGTVRVFKPTATAGAVMTVMVVFFNIGTYCPAPPQLDIPDNMYVLSASLAAVP